MPFPRLKTEDFLASSPVLEAVAEVGADWVVSQSIEVITIFVRLIKVRAACLFPERAHRLAGNAVAEAAPLQEGSQLRPERLEVGPGEGAQAGTGGFQRALAVAFGVHHSIARLAIHPSLA